MTTTIKLIITAAAAVILMAFAAATNAHTNWETPGMVNTTAIETGHSHTIPVDPINPTNFPWTGTPDGMFSPTCAQLGEAAGCGLNWSNGHRHWESCDIDGRWTGGATLLSVMISTSPTTVTTTVAAGGFSFTHYIYHTGPSQDRDVPNTCNF